MATINIPKSNTDPFFRYKREEIRIQILNNNGGVTKLLNIEAIALTLNSSVKSILNYFKKKLNATVMEKDNIIKKVETVSKLEEILESYILECILCTQCANPEFTEKNNIRECKACGFSRNN